MTPNPSLVLNKINDITFESYDAPEITEPTDVIVEVKKTGICGSDIHYYTHGAIGNFVLKSPMVLGHESSGVVSAVGKGVTSLKVGDKVAIEPGVPSRLSDEYKSGHYNLCPHMVFAATPNPEDGGVNPPGTLCKYYKSPEDFLVKLPDHVSLELGALVEPLTVGVHAAKLGSIKFGDAVVVFGAGPVGLLAAAVATKFGATKVMVVDIFDSKLEMAKEIGVATHTFNPKSGSNKDLIAAFDNTEPSVVMECSGAEPCIKSSVDILRVGGRHIQIGNCAKPVSFPMTEFITKELTLFGSFRYGFNDYKTSVAILDENYRNGKENAAIDFESLITHRFKFDEAIDAYDLVKGGNDCVKCIISGPE
ncbi:D-xylulose reductase [Debaryomyces fabryi]|uniref:D-xylulose reductase n=1 Tax=Debaryomyces fabryi TaxID=58627 RepID=A0A0V1PXE6_9ASCO|nr:D-xylulose reductase [Debaryomyces fabryi]KSA00904.1 D-xylulose reductase [Debaryomyces fabryi]CUM51797.1 unnamed protein product [Debaryomyces fabryi]